MATIGRSAAVAEIGRLKLHGFTAWLAWLFVHLPFLIGLRNKLAVFVQWVNAYVSNRSRARIIIPPTWVHELPIRGGSGLREHTHCLRVFVAVGLDPIASMALMRIDSQFYENSYSPYSRKEPQ